MKSNFFYRNLKNLGKHLRKIETYWVIIDSARFYARM